MDSIQGLFVNTSDLLVPYVAVIAVIVSSIGYMSACALSLEGGAFWLVKSMPISARTLLLAKALPQMIIAVPVEIITGICLSIASGISPVYGVFVVLIGAVMSVVFAFLGISVNTLFPRFDYTSEAHVVKQSLAAGLSMFFQMAVGFAFIPLMLWFENLQFAPILSLSIMLGISLLLAVTFAVIALIPCASKIEKMNV